jgi:hypothetical protein
MELKSAILNIKRHPQTSPDQGAFQATEICLEAWKTEALMLLSFHCDRWLILNMCIKNKSAVL